MRVENERNRLYRLATFLALSAACIPIVARSQSDQDLLAMDIEDLSHVKVYSASRHLENIQDAPSSVSIITADEIQRYGWRTLGDALRSLRGFYTSNDRQYTYLGIRGFLRPGDFNSRILELLNGHRLNENVYGSAAIGTEFPLDLDLIDHIEVVRGPGSSLYGTNAMFGVINIITRLPSQQPTIDTSGDTSSFLGRSGRATIMGGKGDLSGLLSASLDRSDGPSTLYFPIFASPDTNNGIAENMDGTRIAVAYSDVHYGQLRVQGMFSDRVKKFPTGSYGAVFNNPADQLEDTRALLDASFHHSFASQMDLDVRAYYDFYNYVGTGAFAIPDSTQPVIGYGKARADWVGTEVNITKQFGESRLTVGGEYEYTIDATQRNFNAGQPDSFHSDRSSYLGAVYGEAQLDLVPKLIIHAGGRLDYFSNSGAAVSPRFALIYKPTPRSTLKYIFGKAFRSPNAYEEYYADDVTIAPAPERLEPEGMLSNEIVFEHRPVTWLGIIADGYYNRLRKLIDQVPDGNTGLSYFVNDGRVLGKGLELELSAERKTGLAVRASYTASTTVDDVAHGPLANSPITQVKLDGTMPVFKWGFGSADMLYVSALTDYQGTRVPSYLLPSLTLSTKPSPGGWQVSASCYDVSNSRSFSPMGPNDPEDQIQQDGRTYRVKLSYRLPLRRRRGDR